MSEIEIRAYAAQFIRSYQGNGAIRKEYERIHAGVREFVREHPFPDGSALVKEVIGEGNPYIQALSYDLAKRLWAAADNSAEDMCAEIRRVGYLMQSQEHMQFHQYLIHEILCNDEGIFNEERRSHGLPYPAVKGYKLVINKMWEGVHGWEN